MVNATTLLIRPTRENSNKEKDAPQATDSPFAESPEDDHLADRVERALHATGYGDLRIVRVSVLARIVILGGRVSSYYLKQIAQVTTQAVPGVHQIRNGLDVVKPN